ncbi:MAG: peptide-methionine (S)-S-oxide reductase MsrA [Myxococcota bacterium]
MSKSAALLLGLSTSPRLLSAQKVSKPPVPTVATDTATFAGGCFWCMELPLRNSMASTASLRVLREARGEPVLQGRCNGRTGHTEAVQVTFDPQEISYDDLPGLLAQYRSDRRWGQFVDRGRQYRPGIFVHNAPLQKKLAESSREQLAASGRFKKPLVVEITDFQAFYPAESYHQDFYKKDATRYKRYRQGSGRDAFIRSVWGEDAHSSSNKISPKTNTINRPTRSSKKS